MQAGESIAIHGASGGVGHLALQIATALGAFVAATTARSRAGERGRLLGRPFCAAATASGESHAPSRNGHIFSGSKRHANERRAMARSGDLASRTLGRDRGARVRSFNVVDARPKSVLEAGRLEKA